MSCQTCSHTMQKVGVDRAGRHHWWCPRCGTLKSVSPPANPAVGFTGSEWTDWGIPKWAAQKRPEIPAPDYLVLLGLLGAVAGHPSDFDITAAVQARDYLIGRSGEWQEAAAKVAEAIMRVRNHKPIFEVPTDADRLPD